MGSFTGEIAEVEQTVYVNESPADAVVTAFNALVTKAKAGTAFVSADWDSVVTGSDAIIEATDLVGDASDMGSLTQTPNNYDVRRLGSGTITQKSGAAGFDPMTLNVIYKRETAKTKAVADMRPNTKMILGIRLNSDPGAPLSGAGASTTQSVILVYAELTGKPTVDLTAGAVSTLTLNLLPLEEYITIDQIS